MREELPMKKTSITALLLTLTLSVFTGCTNEKNNTAPPDSSVSSSDSGNNERAVDSAKDSSVPAPNSDTPKEQSDADNKTPASSDKAGTTTDKSNPVNKSASSSSDGNKTDEKPKSNQPSPKTPDNSNEAKDKNGSGSTEKNTAMQVAAKPNSIAVLVNKQFALPKSYEPSDLVYPDVPFIFKEKIEKRKMRREAAEALEKMFKGAEKDGVYLAGVSAYRSYATQTTLFNRYAKKDGMEKARTYSALPGTSEHETGLAIDVSGTTGKCAASDCFAGSKEADWLDKHAAEYGFIIRYPKGKEAITGYKYEPWHIRYVGTKIAKEIARRGITLEEYLNAVPVSK
jgi:D-alanyl-D-alanine carboxypeptidase